MDLSLGYSPCPNDTFIFHALVQGLVAADGLRFRERLADVETLNRQALGAAGAKNRLAARGSLDVTKVSYGAVPYLLDDYILLRSGGALGRGCGPLVVAREPLPLEDIAGLRVAIPGRYTTANLLLRLFAPLLAPGEERVYSEIMPAVVRGEVDAGLIIHESRFTYAQHGLVELIDLGEWWEGETRLPIPLGGILARRDLGERVVRSTERAIRASVEHAFQNPDASRDYVRAHAQEMDAAVVRQHIDLYVNEFSVDLGAEGERAVQTLLRRAAAEGLSPPAEQVFLAD